MMSKTDRWPLSAHHGEREGERAHAVQRARTAEAIPSNLKDNCGGVGADKKPWSGRRLVP